MILRIGFLFCELCASVRAKLQISLFPNGDEALVYNLTSLSHVCHFENGRAWVSDPAVARSAYAKATADRSENVALPSFHSRGSRHSMLKRYLMLV
jgi:hypothetical protein